MKPIVIASISLFLLLSTACLAPAQWKYQPTAENLKTREWFQDAKFGLFIH
jgi:alpha-L-fucosidase